MLPRRFRLTVAEFRGNPHSTRTLVLSSIKLVIKHSEKENPRFVVVVPKAVDKRSSYRHETKRIIIETIRKYIKNIKKKDILVKARKIIKKEERIRLENEITQAFKKVG